MLLAEKQEGAWNIWRDCKDYRMAGAKSPKRNKGDEAREADWADHTRQEPRLRDTGLALRAVVSLWNSPA